MEDLKNYFVIAYYILTQIENPALEVAKHQEFFKEKNIMCRIYISQDGINGQMSAFHTDAVSYMDWLKQDPRFSSIEFKLHTYHEHAFPKCTVKMRKQLVALDVPVDLEKRGESVSPEKWKEMLENRDEDTLILDVRNDYEWKIGHFEGSILPPLETFRQFVSYAKQLKEERDPKKTKVMMCCTGGIRAEYYSSLLKEQGFENVYQLEGGMIKYGLEEGSKHWKGKLFVFDDRLAVSLKEGEESEIIGTCLHCNKQCDVYYNCASMDCNELFISCVSCAEETLGCCSKECQSSPRLRLYQKVERPKPFRKWCPCFSKDEG